MDALPYELLQLIASGLLPRNQCRLAIASKYCYLYLYNDLLRWHARKQHILVPKYKIKGSVCIRQTTKLLCYEANISHEITYNMSERPCPKHIYAYLLKHDITLFDGFYKYMHKEYRTFYMTVRLSPLLSLPQEILLRICSYKSLDHNTYFMLFDVHVIFKYMQMEIY